MKLNQKKSVNVRFRQLTKKTESHIHGEVVVAAKALKMVKVKKLEQKK